MGRCSTITVKNLQIKHKKFTDTCKNHLVHMAPGAWISMWQLVLQASDDVPENDEWKQNRLEVGNKINSEDKDATVVRFVNAWRVCLILAKWSLTFWLCKSSLACSLYGLNFGSKDTICFEPSMFFPHAHYWHDEIPQVHPWCCKHLSSII